MKRYALAALALLLCCALSGCMGLQILWKGLDGISQPTPETTQKVKDEPEETPPAASVVPEETPVPDENDFQFVKDALARNDGSFDEAYRQAADRLYAREQSSEDVNTQRTELLQIWLESKRDNSVSSEEVYEQYKAILPDVVEQLLDEEAYYNHFAFDFRDLNFDGIPELILHYRPLGGSGKGFVHMALVEIVDGQPIVSTENGKVEASSEAFYSLALVGNPQENELSWIACLNEEWPYGGGYDEDETFEFGVFLQDYDVVKQKRWIPIERDSAGRAFFGTIYEKNVAYEYDREGNLSFDETPIHKIGYRINGEVLDENAFETRYQQEIENKTLLRGPISNACCVLDYEDGKGWSVEVDGEYILDQTDRDQAMRMVYKWMDAFAANLEQNVEWENHDMELIDTAWSNLYGDTLRYFGEFAVFEDIDDKYNLTQEDMLQLFKVNLNLNGYKTKEFYVLDDEGYLKAYRYTEADVQKFLDQFLGEGLKFNAEQAIREREPVEEYAEIWIDNGIITDMALGDSDFERVYCFETKSVSATEVCAYFSTYFVQDEMADWQCCVDLKWDGEKWILKSTNRSA